jgi:tetratricopeptide (TPR) repeat protein
VDALMTERPPADERERVEARKLFEAARDHFARGNFDEAKQCYERSLRLCEDSDVRAAYLEFLATIGPM